MAAQTGTFLFADIVEGFVSLAQRLRDVYAAVAADYHQLIRAGVAADGG